VVERPSEGYQLVKHATDSPNIGLLPVLVAFAHL
jgi:hypothetical protein